VKKDEVIYKSDGRIAPHNVPVHYGYKAKSGWTVRPRRFLHDPLRENYERVLARFIKAKDKACEGAK
jgi:hypothetical protein